MKASKLTLARLFNCGNYEHVRYEVTVELPPGETAADTCRGLENILAALNPSRPSGVPTQAHLDYLKNKVQSAKDLPDGEPGRLELISGCESELLRQQTILDLWNKRREAALAALDDVGGAAHWKDAKADWADDEEF